MNRAETIARIGRLHRERVAPRTGVRPVARGGLSRFVSVLVPARAVHRAVAAVVPEGPGPTRLVGTLLLAYRHAGH